MRPASQVQGTDKATDSTFQLRGAGACAGIGKEILALSDARPPDLGQAKSVQPALQNAAFLTYGPSADDLTYAASCVASINPLQVKYQTMTHPVYLSA